jgi:hypothetical protein
MSDTSTTTTKTIRIRTGDSSGVTAGTYVTSIGPGTRSATIVPSTSPLQTGASSKQAEDAVYGYLQAIRALGRTTVGSTEVAQALKLPRTIVEQALRNLDSKGVRVTMG